MKIHLIKEQTIDNFILDHARSKSSFKNWLTNLKTARWQAPEEIRETYPSADILGNGSDRVVFDIAGNNYRMICKYFFGPNRVHLSICWIGTHAEYTHLCKRGLQYSIYIY
ncbi:mRNA interferase HigB [Dyadobacter soli]|uniref:mRNA interferase HigB n=1 Tax=Dyadobacter soli TaxID=659014 RepID=A0A1G7U2Q3_9BACT|nr:type II toxin-antitoxin system HigB family toxin [Dyadobacter soli]SDG41836.1 mRNA interferase HigB [Dyadobacter soli]